MNHPPNNPSPNAATNPEPASNPASIVTAGAGAMFLLHDVQVELTLEIGRRRMRIADVLKLSTGQTLELTKAAGEPLDIFVNGKLLGRGEAVVVGDRYGVRITEIVAPVVGDRS
jgi:flagellar motor switch protein FliN/FliY